MHLDVLEVDICYSVGGKTMYDFLIVGAGLFGCVFADIVTKSEKTCLVIDKRSHIGGNCYTYEENGIQIHKYGAHIFRTSDKAIWEYIHQFADFNNFINSPVARFHNEIYNLPFNMNTFSKMWGIVFPDEAKRIIDKQAHIIKGEPRNLEEHAIKLVGTDIYEKLIKGYTEKQWGKPCTELPPTIMRRIPLRFTYDNNYYTDTFQGIPIGGYTNIFKKMLQNSEVRLNEAFNRDEHMGIARTIIYTGPIDQFYDYCYGPLEYRSLRFETETLDIANYQGVAVVNYTDNEA